MHRMGGMDAWKGRAERERVRRTGGNLSIDRNKETSSKFSNAHLQHDEGMQFGLFEDGGAGGTHKKRKRKQLVAETDKMTYVGKNYGAYAAAENDLAKYFVGVFDKKTNKVKIYNSEIFLLHPHFPDDEKDGKDEVDMGQSYRDKVDALTEAFGVGKKKRAMNKRQQIQIDSKAMDSAMQSAVALAMKEPSISADTAPHDGEAEGSIIPPHHKDATKPQEAYLLSDIISMEEMEALKTPAQTFSNADRAELAEMHSSEKICSFAHSQLGSLPLAGDARMRKACIVTYLQYLVSLFKMKTADVRRRDFLSEDIPGVIKKKLLHEFTMLSRGGGRKPTTVRCMPVKMKDKVLMQILVLGLILDDFNLEYSALLTDLKVPPTRMAKTLKALGCTSKTQKIGEVAIRMATLPIPLTFPERTTPKKTRPL